MPKAQTPIRRIGEIVASDPIRLTPILLAALPRKKGKVVSNLGALPRPEIMRVLAKVERHLTG